MNWNSEALAALQVRALVEQETYTGSIIQPWPGVVLSLIRQLRAARDAIAHLEADHLDEEGLSWPCEHGYWDTYNTGGCAEYVLGAAGREVGGEGAGRPAKGGGGGC